MNTKKILKAAAWATAPKAMFAVRNPKKTALMKAAGWATSRVLPARRRPSPAMTAAKGFGAAALALPVGLWVGRKLLERRDTGAEI